MRRTRIGAAAAAAAMVLSLAGNASGSTVSDFQARMAQTLWNLQAVEGQLKAQPISSRQAAAPEMLRSFLELLSENVGALAARASSRATEDQKKLMWEGLKTVAANLRDLSSMGAHRGLAEVASQLSDLEKDCRLILADTP
jgi:hypothetical protein